MMNEQFFGLPEEKRMRIINAGLEVFGTNEYKRASTDLIAEKAGISKGLLFYYFHNKKSYYIYLYEYVETMIKESVIDTHFSEITDFFELCEYAAEKKCRLLEKNPHIFDFAVRAFYSTNEDVSEEMNKKVSNATDSIYDCYFKPLGQDKFKPCINPQEIVQMLTWMTDGYMHEKQRTGIRVSIDDIMSHFRRWSSMFRKLSYKED